jgi:hypothetical protein
MTAVAESQFDTKPAVPSGSAPTLQGNSPMEIGDTVTLRPRNNIRRDVPRYIVQAGDLLPPATKRSFAGIQGVHLGGEWHDLVSMPCLWKFQGFITRGRITPLIKKPVMAFAAEEIVRKREQEVAEIIEKTGQKVELPAVYRTVFPWDTLRSLMAEHSSIQGVTEVTALEAIDWDTGVVQEIQTFFFPNWEDLVAGRDEMPFLLKDFRAHIRSRQELTGDDTIKAVADAYLESCDKFEVYANQVVQSSKEAVRRGMNDLGWAATHQPFHIHLAAQIGVTLESSPTVIVNNQGQSPAVEGGMSAAEIEIKKREIAAQEEANRLKRIELGLEPASDPNAAFAQPEATDVQFAEAEASTEETTPVESAETQTNKNHKKNR